MPWYRKKTTLLLLVVWLHITLLDLFFVLYTGPVFLWEENLRWSTQLVHLLIAVLTWAFYLFITKLRRDYRLGQFKIGENIWIACSLFMLCSIGFLLF